MYTCDVNSCQYVLFSCMHFTQDTVIDKRDQCVCVSVFKCTGNLFFCSVFINVFFRMQARLWSIKTISLFSQLQCSVYMYVLLLPECQHCLHISCTSSLCGPNVHHCHQGWVINPVSDDNIYVHFCLPLHSQSHVIHLLPGGIFSGKQLY